MTDLKDCGKSFQYPPINPFWEIIHRALVKQFPDKNDYETRVLGKFEPIEKFKPKPGIGYIGTFGGKNIYRPPSTHKRVFKKGKRILSLIGFVQWAYKGGWFFVRHKAYHPGWAMSWSLHFIIGCITGCGVYRAVRINAKH